MSKIHLTPYASSTHVEGDVGGGGSYFKDEFSHKKQFSANKDDFHEINDGIYALAIPLTEEDLQHIYAMIEDKQSEHYGGCAIINIDTDAIDYRYQHVEDTAILKMTISGPIPTPGFEGNLFSLTPVPGPNPDEMVLLFKCDGRFMNMSMSHIDGYLNFILCSEVDDMFNGVVSDIALRTLNVHGTGAYFVTGNANTDEIEASFNDIYSAFGGGAMVYLQMTTRRSEGVETTNLYPISSIYHDNRNGQYAVTFGYGRDALDYASNDPDEWMALDPQAN